MAAEMHNLHGTACILGDRGIMIMGPSGSGKSTLALALINAAHQRGQFTALIADDQLLISTSHGRIIIEAPSAIAGRIELYGLGIAKKAHCHAAILDLVVMLRPKSEIERMPVPKIYKLAGIDVEQINLPSQSNSLNIQSIFHFLSGQIVENA